MPVYNSDFKFILHIFIVARMWSICYTVGQGFSDYYSFILLQNDEINHDFILLTDFNS